MKGQLLILTASILWMLMCMRFWWVIDRRNRWQRHAIALAAGIGAGLIYIVGSMVITLLKVPSKSDLPAPVEQAEDIRIGPRPAK